MARADGEETLKFDESNVLDDLTGSTINGAPFSLLNYNFDRKKETQILSSIEYSYSFYEDKQSNYGLYVYVYNPKGIKFFEWSSLNKIQFSITSERDIGYKKYHLTHRAFLLEKARTQSEKEIAKAKQEAEQIIAEAQTQRDKLQLEAKSQGFEQGHSEGYEKGAAEVNRLIERMHKILEAVMQRREEILKDTEIFLINKETSVPKPFF